MRPPWRVSIALIACLAGACSEEEPRQRSKAAPYAEESEVETCAGNPGASAPRKILNGTPGERCAYPQVVRLLVQAEGKREQICTATLIAPQLVLTAAHCVMESVASFRAGRAGAYPLRKGELAVSIPDEGFLDLSFTAIHDDYDEEEIYSPDLALVRLPRPVTKVPPLALAESATVGARAKAMGFGYDGRGEDGMGGYDQLLTALLVILDLPSAVLVSGRNVPSAMVHAKGNGQETCPGDSGGPLLDERGRVLGVLSSGYYYGLNGRVREHGRCVDSLDNLYTATFSELFRAWLPAAAQSLR